MRHQKLGLPVFTILGNSTYFNSFQHFRMLCLWLVLLLIIYLSNILLTGRLQWFFTAIIPITLNCCIPSLVVSSLKLQYCAFNIMTEFEDWMLKGIQDLTLLHGIESLESSFIYEWGDALFVVYCLASSVILCLCRKVWDMCFFKVLKKQFLRDSMKILWSRRAFAHCMIYPFCNPGEPPVVFKPFQRNRKISEVQ